MSSLVQYYVIGASVSEAPSCGLNGRAVPIDIYIRPAPATAHARRYAQTYIHVSSRPDRIAHARPKMLSISLVMSYG